MRISSINRAMKRQFRPFVSQKKCPSGRRYTWSNKRDSVVLCNSQKKKRIHQSSSNLTKCCAPMTGKTSTRTVQTTARWSWVSGMASGERKVFILRVFGQSWMVSRELYNVLGKGPYMTALRPLPRTSIKLKRLAKIWPQMSSVVYL